MKLALTIASATLVLLTLCANVPAAAASQQEKMATCNKDASAKNLTGDARKAFMSSCLSSAPATPMTQQEKMTACNKSASDKGLTGDARKAFMSDCLKAK